MVTINGIEFELYNYQQKADGISLTIRNTTTEAVETAVGESADIVISDEYRGYGLKISTIFKKYGSIPEIIVELKTPNVEETIRQNSIDIEMNALAIEELARIISGEDEDIPDEIPEN